MTDTTETAPAVFQQTSQVLAHAERLLADGVERFSGWLETLDLQDLRDLGEAFAIRSRVDTFAAGQIAYTIRTKTPDGAWGQEVRRLAGEWGVSDRSIHRWMSAYQSAAGLELTPAQANAEARAASDARQAGAEPEGDMWDDEEEASAAGFELDDDEDLLARMNRESGWGDHLLPSADYEAAEAPPREERRVLPVDETWSAFTQSQMVAEHPHLEGVAAERAAKLRWDRAVRETPLDLLEDLEDIHGGNPPVALVEALYAAEEAKAIKPDAVEEPPKKKRSGGGGGAKTPEGLMVSTRELHQRIVKAREERGAAAVVAEFGSGEGLAHLQGLVHAAQGCLNKVRSAVEATKQTGGAKGSDEPGF